MMRLGESPSCSSSLFEHDLRANAFRVCREGKPVSTFPDHALGSKLNQTIEVRLQIRFKLCKELGDGK